MGTAAWFFISGHTAVLITNQIKKGFMMQEEKPNNFRLPKMLTSMGHAHEDMKFYLITTLILFVLTLIVLLYLVSKHPLVITFNTRE